MQTSLMQDDSSYLYTAQVELDAICRFDIRPISAALQMNMNGLWSLQNGYQM
ncbi:unnamed protein product [Amoebophrya sp. A120]|nr:unnamed protein product [Amoebophrya sp. A120]|eukprot:GSA120T00015492001.1